MTASQARKQRRAGRIRDLEEQLQRALLGEWSAKKGLIAYMDEHGLADRVNATVRAEVAAGPPVLSVPNDQKGD